MIRQDIILLCFSNDKEISSLALHVRAFWGRSNEGRGVFVWVDFKYQQVFHKLLTAPLNMVQCVKADTACKGREYVELE